ncbi:MAG TPA: hypothetical protein VEC37_18730 [Bacillota bacterium]|nr:hypothetical protein [Bacillota bacterium]
MTGDIKLNDNGVIINGEINSDNNQIKFTAYDLLLDNAARRKPGSNPQKFRRALVHNFGDQLVLNYEKDYPGGVAIHGAINGENDQLKISAYDLLLDNPSRRKPGSDSKTFRRALVHGNQDQLILNFGSDYPGGVEIHGAISGQDKKLKIAGDVTIEGMVNGVNNQFKITAYDLLLDNPGRRKPVSASKAFRRALVHGYGDQLVINCENDYPGGVAIHGTITGENDQLKISAYDLLLDNPTRRKPGSDPKAFRRALVHGSGDQLIINFANDYPSGVAIHGAINGENNQLKISAYDLLLDNPDRRKPGSNSKAFRRALVHGYGDQLVINCANDYPGGVAIHGAINGENNQLKISAYDLLLDNPDRRKPGSDPKAFRRALVHSSGDQLVINYENDYSSGVAIHGKVEIGDSLVTNRIDCKDPQTGITFQGKVITNDSFKCPGVIIGNDPDETSPSNPDDTGKPLDQTYMVINGKTILIKKVNPTRLEPVSFDLVKEVQLLGDQVTALQKEVLELKKLINH